MNDKTLSFLNGNSVVKISNAKDFEELKTKLTKYELIDELTLGKKERSKISWWRHIAQINCKDYLRPNFPLFFERQPYKGITFNWDFKSVKGWWGEENILKPSEI